MLDGTKYVECVCDSSEHVLRFTLDADADEIYTEVYLNNYLVWYKRVWRAIRYVFGYRSKYGHWDCTIFNHTTVQQMRDLFDEFDKLKNKEQI